MVEAQPTWPGWLAPSLILVAAAGLVVFVLTVIDSPAQAWRIYHVNFLLWSGVTTGAVALAAIFEVSHARWPLPVRRMAEACAAYLPVVFALFVGTWLGREAIFHWAAPDSGVHKPWLNLNALYARDSIGLLLLCSAGVIFAYRSLRFETRGRSLRHLAIALLFLFVLVNALLAVDLVMSLDPHWSSSLFGGYFFAGNLYLGIAAATALTVVACRWLGAGQQIDARILNSMFSNMGRMLFSFSLIWMYLIWSQYLVIWYGNLPQETGYVQLRIATQPWKSLSYAVLLLNFVLPFLLLLPKAAKQNGNVLLAVALMILTGTWIERLVLIGPPLTTAGQSLFEFRDALITAGFAASFLLVLLTTLRRPPILKSGQPRGL